MRQAFRRYAFPMMIIAAVLAAALPLNSFAIDISTVNMTDDFAYNTLASNSWSYLVRPVDDTIFPSTFSSSRTLSYLNYSADISSVSSKVFCRSSHLYFSSTPLRTFEFRFPLFLYDIYSLDFSFYFGIVTEFGASYSYDVVDIILHTSGTSIDIPFDLSSNDFSLSSDPYYSTFEDVNLPIDSYNIKYSSTSSFDAVYLSFIFSFSIPSSVSSSNPLNLLFSFALDVNSSFSTVSSNVDALMQSHAILAQLIDSVILQQSSSNAQIIDYLDQILAAVEAGGGTGSGGSGSDPGTGEGEDILQEGAIKQEQLEELGQALGDVPKPSIQDVSQLIDPNVSLSTSSPQMVQTALNIVYSWDKFLAILALVIALGTISYILFGKKS